MEPFPLLRLVPALPRAAAPDDVLFRGEHVVVTRERFEVDGRSWRLDYIESVAVARHSPRHVPLQLGAMLGGALLLLPGVLLFSSRRAPDGSGLGEALLVVAALALFAAIARLLLLSDTYWLEVRTAYGTTRPYRSTDREHVLQVASVLQRAVDEYPPRA